jgi:D-glycero-alpha-D-manno-heptose-7-phosphate kinase
VIEASAPVRICDNGGWTDTWFGGPGRVLNIAVTPGVKVSIDATDGPDSVILDVSDVGDRYAVSPGTSRVARHALLEAAVDAFPPPAGRPVEVNVCSAVPPGCGAGTSAAVAVALLGALAELRNERLSTRQAAYAAYALEVDVLGRESGIQDQLCAAFGGINFLRIERFPDATVEPMPAWDELGSLLTLVFLGRAHDSSGVHRQVIDDVRRQGSAALALLRETAAAARDAVMAQDLQGFGRSMIDNTEAQAGLHPALVGRDALRVIEIAAAERALGWKVNGAGGDGGSITLLSRSKREKATLEAVISATDPRYRVLPVRVSPAGLRVSGRIDDP